MKNSRFSTLTILLVLSGANRPSEASRPARIDCGESSRAVTDEASIDRIVLDREIWNRKVSLKLQNVPLIDVLQQLAKAADVPLKIDSDALRLDGEELQRINSVTITDVELVTALHHLLSHQYPQFSRRQLRSAQLDGRLLDGALLISTVAAEIARTNKVLPDKLRSLFENGKIYPHLDREQQVASMHVYVPLTDDLLQRLAGLPKLKELELHGPTAELTEEGVSEFRKLVSLERLRASGTGSLGATADLVDQVMEQLGTLKTLRSLELSETGVSDRGIELACRSDCLTAIHLYQEGKLTDQAMVTIAGQSQLKQVGLVTYVGTPTGRMHFSSAATRLLRELEDLERLDLTGQSYSSDMFAFPRLRGLSISGKEFEEADAARIARSPELGSLNLFYSRIPDKSLTWLADHPELRDLQIRCNDIKDTAFESFRTTPKLNRIHLWTSGLTDKSLDYFSQIKSLKTLSFNWGSNSFTADGVKGLATSIGLQSVELRIIPMTGGGIGIALKEEVPEGPVVIELPAKQLQLQDDERKRLPIDVEPLIKAMPKIRVSITHDAFMHSK